MQPNAPPDNNNWTFRPEGTNAAPQPDPYVPATPGQPLQTDSVTWTASEFIAHHKSASWYFACILGFLVLTVPIYVFTKDIISIVSISVVFILFLVISAGKPRQRTYTIDNHGIAIDARFYPYSLFKSFGLSDSGAFSCINFVPLKRFMGEIEVYFAPEDEERILTVLMENLPNDQQKEKLTDRLAKQIRF